MSDDGTASAAHSLACYNAGKIEALEKRIKSLEETERRKEEALRRGSPSPYDLSRHGLPA